MEILFCNTGWMNFYDGLSSIDNITGGGSYIQEHGEGGEIHNFSEFRKRYYGYVRSSIYGTTNIDKLGANSYEEKVDNILVVWLATHPSQGGIRIVGWYKNATVYRYMQEPPKNSKRGKLGFEYNIESNVSDSFLLPIDERTFIVPKATKDSGGMGRSNIFYCEGEKNKKIKDDVIAYVMNFEKNKYNRPKLSAKKADSLQNKKVENNAIDAAKEYYSNLGYNVISVETENLGWDLEATIRNKTLLIEVKGTSLDSISINLTPNEYKKMNEYYMDYRLFILTNALKKREWKTHIFSFDFDSGEWKDYEKRVLSFEEVISARVTV